MPAGRITKAGKSMDASELADQLSRARYERLRAASGAGVPYDELSERVRRIRVQQSLADAEWFAARFSLVRRGVSLACARTDAHSEHKIPAEFICSGIRARIEDN